MNKPLTCPYLLQKQPGSKDEVGIPASLLRSSFSIAGPRGQGLRFPPPHIHTSQGWQSAQPLPGVLNSPQARPTPKQSSHPLALSKRTCQVPKVILHLQDSSLTPHLLTCLPPPTLHHAPGGFLPTPLLARPPALAASHLHSAVSFSSHLFTPPDFLGLFLSPSSQQSLTQTCSALSFKPSLCPLALLALLPWPCGAPPEHLREGAGPPHLVASEQRDSGL